MGGTAAAGSAEGELEGARLQGQEAAAATMGGRGQHARYRVGACSRPAAGNVGSFTGVPFLWLHILEGGRGEAPCMLCTHCNKVHCSGETGSGRGYFRPCRPHVAITDGEGG